MTTKEPENLKQKMASNGEITNTNKGIPTEPTKSRASVTENVNNANQEYPIRHGVCKTILLLLSFFATDMYFMVESL